MFEFENFNEQFEKSLKPYNELVNVNAKALEQLAQQQAELFTSNLKEGVSYAQNLSAQKDLAAIVEEQRVFAENLQEKLTNAAKEAYGVIASAQEQAGDILKGAFAEAQETVKTAAPVKAPKASKAK